MLFVESRFLEFFAIVFCVYWALRSNGARKIWLLGASYAFYAGFFVGAEDLLNRALPAGWWFPLLLAASTCIDYFVGLRLEDETKPLVRRLWLTASLCVNLGVLVYFKYAGFFLGSAAAFLGWLGLPASPYTLRILLPVGVSFYTFQSMSYTIEVYRRHLPAERSLLNLAAFVAFFPQLVAGPIVRAAAFLPQLRQIRRWSEVDVRGALVLFLVGFAKKKCVSDNVSPFVDRYFADPIHFTGASARIAVLLYAVQIYCDFSGYTDMAIAVARLLGYELTKNFDFPYFATSIVEFWRRWHISLSTWLRDYLYISLGGNRGSQWTVIRNLMITMLLGGLWHGSSWTFAVWGGLHGAALVAHRAWLRRRFGKPRPSGGKLVEAAGVVCTFGFVCICWIFFRSADLTKPMTGGDFTRALFIVRKFVSFSTRAERHGYYSLDPRLLWLFAGLCLIHWLNYRRHFAAWWRRGPAWIFALGYGLSAEALLLVVPMNYAPFIYFQF